MCHQTATNRVGMALVHTPLPFPCNHTTTRQAALEAETGGFEDIVDDFDVECASEGEGQAVEFGQGIESESEEEEDYVIGGLFGREGGGKATTEVDELSRPSKKRKGASTNESDH